MPTYGGCGNDPSVAIIIIIIIILIVCMLCYAYHINNPPTNCRGGTRTISRTQNNNFGNRNLKQIAMIKKLRNGNATIYYPPVLACTSNGYCYPSETACTLNGDCYLPETNTCNPGSARALGGNHTCKPCNASGVTGSGDCCVSTWGKGSVGSCMGKACTYGITTNMRCCNSTIGQSNHIQGCTTCPSGHTSGGAYAFICPSY